MKSSEKKEASVHSQHLINISCTLTKLNNVCHSYKNEKTLSNENISLVKRAIADISKGKEQLASLMTLLKSNGIMQPTTLNNQQISDKFLKDLQILYGKYVSSETKKVKNKYSELKKKEGGCCSIF